jgi:hypothetical protein
MTFEGQSSQSFQVFGDGSSLLGFALVREKGIFEILNSSLALAYHLLKVDLFGLPHGVPSIELPTNPCVHSRNVVNNGSA